MNYDLRKLLKHTNRKKNKKSVNNKKINHRGSYYTLDDTPPPDTYSGF